MPTSHKSAWEEWGWFGYGQNKSSTMWWHCFCKNYEQISNFRELKELQNADYHDSLRVRKNLVAVKLKKIIKENFKKHIMDLWWEEGGGKYMWMNKNKISIYKFKYLEEISENKTRHGSKMLKNHIFYWQF